MCKSTEKIGALPSLSLSPLKAAKRKGFLDHGNAWRGEAVAVEHALSLVRVRTVCRHAPDGRLVRGRSSSPPLARWIARAVWTFDKWEGLMRGWQGAWDPKVAASTLDRPFYRLALQIVISSETMMSCFPEVSTSK